MTNTLRRGMQVGAILAVFGTGYLCGTISERRAVADMNTLGGAVGGAVMKEAAGGSGVVGQAAKLGTAITDMQSQVDGLQKNLETLKAIKGALGG
ncbi:MAG: hypothetical protein B6D46_03335 [Polyangiaceae bacterium UTPRO1]|jgi:hypothetical protein|nr:hypothetical protein [Myxococcales bacterium]OQY68441.1 MAG: hypothetical protein B6D46_03335 [Polyangiaceae bacterium UTPRO1]